MVINDEEDDGTPLYQVPKPDVNSAGEKCRPEKKHNVSKAQNKISQADIHKRELPLKSKREKKKPELSNNSEEQLKVAQSYIVTLEAKLNGTQDANRILRQDLKRIGGVTEVAVKSENVHQQKEFIMRSDNISRSKASSLKESIIVMELVNTRRNSLEH